MKLLGFAALLMLGSSAAVPSRVIQRIEIRSSWRGLGTPADSMVTILRARDAYVRNNQEKIDTVLVEALSRAIAAPPRRKPDLDNLGCNTDWRRKHAVRLAREKDLTFDDAAENQRDLFTQAFNDPVMLLRIVVDSFDRIHTDDYPSLQVVITFTNGQRTTLTTTSQQGFLLPWKVAQTGTNFNADLSRAVAALMPTDAVNRDRLLGQGFAEDLAGDTLGSIREKWKFLDAQNRAGTAIAAVRTVYSVQQAAIENTHGVSHGKEWKKGEPGETNLHLDLRKASFPSNLSLSATLLFENEKVEGVDRLLQSAQKYESMVLSIPWLQTLIRKQPGTPHWIAWNHKASLGDHALDVFTADMSTIGKAHLIPAVKAQQADITLLIAGGGHWLVFPDGHLLLWRFNGHEGLLKWKPRDLPSHRCHSYHALNGGCVGLVVTPAGDLVR